MIRLQNELLTVHVSSKGAELQAIHHRVHDIEYLWQGDPAYWAKRSPILFPIVGQLRGNAYQLGGRLYTMSRHGFARDLTFAVEAATDTAARFSLTDSDATRAQYPFSFQLLVTYTLEQDRLETCYEVVNTGEGEMYFSIGGHPAFRVPLTGGGEYEDYFLELEHPESAPRWELEDGLLKRPVPFLHNTTRIPLTKELFYRDALVFKNLSSRHISIKSEATPHGLSLHFPDFPYFGIWAAADAPFVCLEPWDGIADAADHSGDFTQKEGILRLAPGHKYKRCWTVTCW
jgi:galactose mutarotase-like enzyme